MTMLRRTVPRLIFLVLALAAVALPASATITYTSCSSNCDSTSGTYTIWKTAPGSAGLTFSMSAATFAPGNLVSGVYTDANGTVFTGYSDATTADSLALNGTALAQTVMGTNSGIQITLPSNTYAIAFFVTAFNGHNNPVIELGDRILWGNDNYQAIVSSTSSPQFFGIISDTPLTSLFIGNTGGSDGAVQINDFEIGQAEATPEVSTVALIGSGLVLLGVLRRRVHKPDGSV